MSRWVGSMVVAGALALGGCASDAGVIVSEGPSAVATPGSSAASDGAPATPGVTAAPRSSATPSGGLGGALASRVVRGTLGGDAQLEGGCAWLDTATGRVDVSYPEGYAIAFDPLRLTGPDGAVVAAEGDALTVNGRPLPDATSFCQVGELFAADAVTAG